MGKRQLATFLETSKKAFAASSHWSEGISYWQPSCTILKGSVAEPEPQGAATFAGAGAITLIQFLAPAPAPCYMLGILKSFIVTDSAS
jgi:hypothetical protein